MGRAVSVVGAVLCKRGCIRPASRTYRRLCVGERRPASIVDCVLVRF